MLTDIYIKNFSIIETLQLTLHAGLTVITGETGAGKSIILDAVNLALGARAEQKPINANKKCCDITLCFDITTIDAAINWLQEQDLYDGEECIIRRVINSDGRTRSTINGCPCPLSLTRLFANLVLNIHSQHQHQALLKRDHQQVLLDRYARTQNLLEPIQALFLEWRANQVEIEKLTQQITERDQQLELLRYQFNELDQLALQENEWHTLHNEHNKMHNAKQIMTHLTQAIDLTIDDEKSCASLSLQQAIEQVQAIHYDDPALGSIKELLNNAAIHLQEAGNELNHYRNQLDLSPERLGSIEERLTLIHDLARKHHVTGEQLPEVIHSLNQQIDTLENIDTHLATLNARQDSILKTYTTHAVKLTNLRQEASIALSEKVSAKMQKLAMKGGQFTVALEPIDTPISANGQEKCQFLVQTNPGQPLQALSKVVSGGELSRISLALEAITSQKTNTPTLIFDEVDTGIGGKTAETVGKLLNSLGANAQVLCITHLPQVAAFGNHHLLVKKQTRNGNTDSRITQLPNQERLNEMARMLSGSKVTDVSLENARLMLEQAHS